jgi:hypothetical protein
VSAKASKHGASLQGNFTCCFQCICSSTTDISIGKQTNEHPENSLSYEMNLIDLNLQHGKEHVRWTYPPIYVFETPQWQGDETDRVGASNLGGALAVPWVRWPCNANTTIIILHAIERV